MGVAIDRTTKPPRLYGQTELPLESDADVLRVFGAIASRNTAGTGLNDSSSRSHCFAFVTLHVHDDAARTVRTSRFQFVDLAGSERLKDAHNGLANWRTDGMEVVAGMVTNFSLMMLSSCTRALVDAQRRGTAKNFSFRAYIGDLCPVRRKRAVARHARPRDELIPLTRLCCTATPGVDDGARAHGDFRVPVAGA